MNRQIKPILPSLREKKRYLVFEVISKPRINDFSKVSDAVCSSLLSFFGELGAAKAGVWLLPDKYNPETQRGIMRVNRKYVHEAKAALSLVRQIDRNEVIVRSIAVSGILKKASKHISG